MYWRQRLHFLPSAWYGDAIGMWPHKRRATMVKKTRERLIDVARQLFARKGVENTTMSDIAEASEHGRRTLYTYFKTKQELQQAVIERNSEKIVQRERQILAEDISSVEMIRQFMLRRLEELESLPQPRLSRFDTQTLRSFLDNKRLVHTHRVAAKKEIEIFTLMVKRGVERGEFNERKAAQVTPVVLLLLYGAANNASSGAIASSGLDRAACLRHSVDFIIDALTENNSTENLKYNQ